MHGTDRAEEARDKPGEDLFLLFSILLLILVHPLLDGVFWGRVVMSLLTFVPLITAMVRMSQKKALVWPFAALIGATLLCTIVAHVSGSPTVLAIQWLLVTLAFAVSVAGLFSYLFGATRITAGHLYTAGSIYLLLVVLFFAMYSGITALFPDAFQKTTGGTTGTTGNSIDLLYFSMCTLTTVGYGDIVPVRPVVRLHRVVVFDGRAVRRHHGLPARERLQGAAALLNGGRQRRPAIADWRGHRTAPNGATPGHASAPSVAGRARWPAGAGSAKLPHSGAVPHSPPAAWQPDGSDHSRRTVPGPHLVRRGGLRTRALRRGRSIE